MSRRQTKAIVIGAGHNGLISSLYLAKAGVKVVLLEGTEQAGGASVSQKVFAEYEAHLSRYSYLVSLMPDQIREELELSFETLGRRISSFTPTKIAGEDVGLLVERVPTAITKESFAQFGATSFTEWEDFYARVQKLADVIAPTMLGKLPSRSELKAAVGDEIWDEIMERPLGQVLEQKFSDDLVRGVVLTDGLIGTHADAHHMAANICFLYHLIGNGTGEWRVPKGGMGSLVKELLAKANAHGVEILTSHRVSLIKRAGETWQVECTNGASFNAPYVLAACAPQTLAKVSEYSAPKSLDGSQVKINMLLQKLPRLKSGIDAKDAFAGTFHIDERYSDLQMAYQQSAAGKVPDRIPAEMYCHTLTDNSILSDDLNSRGFHTLTLFGLHTPAVLFENNAAAVKAEIAHKLFTQLNEYLLDPIEECFARKSDGSPCFEIKSPLELEAEIGLPRGNIFHKDLSMPFSEDGQARSWGVETGFPGLYLAGAGAIRGGGVSGIPGRSAAMAVLEEIGSGS